MDFINCIRRSKRKVVSPGEAPLEVVVDDSSEESEDEIEVVKGSSPGNEIREVCG